MIQNCLFIGSGKGGVGKSTLTVNLGIALASLGLKVGILDADVYGPSVPILTGLRRMSPQVRKGTSGEEIAAPFEKFGIRIMSLGFFMDEPRGVIWRGPMLHGALERMVSQVDWGDLDFLLVDLPPGTGDVLISLKQLLKPKGAIIITTPQKVALMDVFKAVNAFDTLEIPILGFAENMVGYYDEARGIHHDIFGHSQGPQLAERLQIPFLGSIPLDPAIRQGGDEGFPVAFHRRDEGTTAFHSIAETFLTSFKVAEAK